MPDRINMYIVTDGFTEAHVLGRGLTDVKPLVIMLGKLRIAETIEEANAITESAIAQLNDDNRIASGDLEMVRVAIRTVAATLWDQEEPT